MQIGRRIYYDKATGNVILERESRNGSAVDTTVEQDFVAYPSLTQRAPETVGYIQLEYGLYDEDFSLKNGLQVDITGATPTLVFSYPDPNVPPTPPVYQKPLTVQLAELKAEKQVLEQQAAQTSTDLAGFMDYYFSKNPEPPVV